MEKGYEAPIRVVQGSHTGLADPHGMVLDDKKKLLFVGQSCSYHEVKAPLQAKSGAKPFTRDSLLT